MNLFLEKWKNIHANSTINDLSLGNASQGVSLVTNQKGVTCIEDLLEADQESSQSCDNGCHETTNASLSSSSALLISLKNRSKMIAKDMTSPPKKLKPNEEIKERNARKKSGIRRNMEYSRENQITFAW